MTNDLRQRVAGAMEAKRQELIAKPMARIWPDLADAAIAAMSEWRPISTAPKDGTVVDLWIVGHDDIVDFYAIGAKKMKGRPVRHGRATCFQWEKRGPNPPNWYAAGGLAGMPPLSPDVRPTHWRPIPLPPHPEGE